MSSMDETSLLERFSVSGDMSLQTLPEKTQESNSTNKTFDDSVCKQIQLQLDSNPGIDAVS